MINFSAGCIIQLDDSTSTLEVIKELNFFGAAIDVNGIINNKTTIERLNRLLIRK